MTEEEREEQEDEEEEGGEEKKLNGGTRLSAMGKEFFFAQKRRIASQARIRVRAEQGLEMLGRTILLEQLKQMTKEKVPFPEVIKLVKPVLQDNRMWDEDMEFLYGKYSDLETYLAEVLESSMTQRPIWTEWLQYVKGVGLLTAAEVISLFESAFKQGEDWRHFGCPSQMLAFAGLHTVNGKAPKKARFQKANFKDDLRSVLVGRIGPGLLRGRGGYKKIYDAEKARRLNQYAAQGVKVVEAAKLPLDEKGKRYEPEGVISEGHVHNICVRKMVKIFVQHLFQMMYEVELGIPSPRLPYVFGVLSKWK